MINLRSERWLGLGGNEAVREKFQAITSRFASYQAQWLNDYPC